MTCRVVFFWREKGGNEDNELGCICNTLFRWVGGYSNQLFYDIKNISIRTISHIEVHTLQSRHALSSSKLYERRFPHDVSAHIWSSDADHLPAWQTTTITRVCLHRMPLRERRKEERQRVTFLFLYTPCVSAAPLKCMGVSSQKDYVQCRVERAQRQLSHWDIVKKNKTKNLRP